MQNCPFSFGPQAVGTSVANILQAGTTTGGVLNGSNFESSIYVSLYIILRHMRVINTTDGDVSVSLFISTTGDGTATKGFAWSGTVVPANSYLDWVGYCRLDAAEGQFLTGSQDGASGAIVINGEGEIGIAAGG
jgi:hypothetical protein